MPSPVIAPDHTADPLTGMLDFTGQVAVVTGAASGIGRACAARLAEAGARVYGADIAYCAGHDQERPAAGAGPGGVEAAGLDVTDPGAVEALVGRIGDTEGRLDIWVHAAGVLPRGDVLDLPLADWRRVLATNLDGTFICAQAAGRAMAAAGGGIIIALASTVAYRVNSNAAHYRATKAGVLALIQNLAIELAPRGVRALAVCPTLTLTEGALRLQSDGTASGLGRYAARLPLGRAAHPDDVARVVVFAASPLAAYMTGSALIVDGGELQR